MDQTVVNTIQTLLSGGKSKEEIYATLLSQGSSIAQIEAGFTSLSTSGEREDTHKRTIHIIVTIGALLIGAGIFSLIASNWTLMDKATKVAIIIVAMLGAYGIGWYLKEYKNYLRTGNALIFLGLLIYGGGIFLIAQIFNIRGNWPDGFILWMFGVLAIAFATDLFNLYYLAIILAVVALFGHPGIIFQAGGTPDPYLLTSSFLLLLTTVMCFITGWTIRQKIPQELRDL